MIQRIVRVLRRTGLLYLERQIPRSSAAMAYYLTMSLFPLIVCLYALLGKSYQQMSRVLELADHVLQPTTTQYLKSFLLYVANNPSKTMCCTRACGRFTAAARDGERACAAGCSASCFPSPLSRCCISASW